MGGSGLLTKNQKKKKSCQNRFNSYILDSCDGKTYNRPGISDDKPSWTQWFIHMQRECLCTGYIYAKPLSRSIRSSLNHLHLHCPYKTAHPDLLIPGPLILLLLKVWHPPHLLQIRACSSWKGYPFCALSDHCVGTSSKQIIWDKHREYTTQ